MTRQQVTQLAIAIEFARSQLDYVGGLLEQDPSLHFESYVKLRRDYTWLLEEYQKVAHV